MVECLDCLARITSKELAPFRSLCEKWHPPESLFYKTESGWPGGWDPQGMRSTGGGGLVRVPNLRVCDHQSMRGGPCRGRRMN